jgi:serine/threonine protein kinase/formylglycine-generating enzyme required for sulfatase activity
MTRMWDMVGRKLGDYRLVEAIGAGAMGSVFRAENIHHKKAYALKVLRGELGRDADFRKRFFDEARVMSELDHPNIVRVHHMGEDNGVYYLVMDYVASASGRPRSLHQELMESPTGRIAPNKVYRWAVQLAQGLAYAHRRGVVHRDIKPANVLIGSDGNVRIADFGLVKLVGREFLIGQTQPSMRTTNPGLLQPTVTAIQDRRRQAATSLDVSHTATGDPRTPPSSDFCGTPDYMSPEVLEGREATRQSDLYSLGVAIYRMLTGKRPAGMPKLPSKIIPGLPRRWDTVMRRCLANTLEDRYRSAEELLKDLRRIAKPQRVWTVAGTSALLAIGLVGVAGLSGVDFRGACAAVWSKVAGMVNNRSVANSPSTTQRTAEDHQRDVQELCQALKERPPFADLLQKADERVRSADGLLAEGRKSEAAAAYGQILKDIADGLGGEAERGLATLAGSSRVEGYAAEVGPLTAKKAQADTLRGQAQYAGAANLYLAVIAETSSSLGRLRGQPKQGLQERQKLLEELCRILKAHPEFADPLQKADEQTQKANSLLADGKRADATGVYGEAIRDIVDAVRNEAGRNLAVLAGFSDAREYAAQIDSLKAESTRADALGRQADYTAAVEMYLAAIGKARPILTVLQQRQEVLAARGAAEKERARAEEMEADVCICPQGTVGCTCFHKYYSQAQTLMTEGEDRLKQGRFDLASQHWSDARTGFQNAVAAALREVEKARGEWQEALARPMPERLGQFAKEMEREAGNALAAEKQGKLKTAILAYRRATRLRGLTEELSLPLGAGVKLVLVFVPAGEFGMGSPPEDGGRREEEFSRHAVTIGKSFYVGRYEVTQEQYQIVTNRNPSAFQGPSLPVDSISWHEAEQFCARLTEQLHALGYGRFRLPTEREWEYVCRAGSEGDYAAGNGERALRKIGWYRDVGSSGPGRTRPVGQLEANRWGLYDMSGNVWEWCHDTYVASAVSDDTNPASSDDSASRVLRGGSWNTDLFYCRSASRYGEAPETRRNDIGFRVVMDIE